MLSAHFTRRCSLYESDNRRLQKLLKPIQGLLFPWANFWWVTTIPNCTRQLSKKYCLRTATASSSNMTIVWRSRARRGQCVCHEGFDKIRDKGGTWSTVELEIVINTRSVTPTNPFPSKADAQAMLSEIKANSAPAPSHNTPWEPLSRQSSAPF